MRESELLEHVYANSPPNGGCIVVGPGDDMAVLDVGGRALLTAVDQVIAGVHVDPNTPAELIGRKAVARSLSDVAAMAARPLAGMATAVLPPGYGSAAARRLFDGMRRTGDEFACPLVGGDVAFHRHPRHPLTCTVTVLAEPDDRPPVLRSAARVGDHVAVTGRLGGAGTVGPDARQPHHLTFRPRIEEACELGKRLGARLHAMIDLSDGLGRDAAHLATASDVSIELDAERLPCRDGVDWRRAAGDGEDYELFFTASGDLPRVVGDGVRVTIIGRVVPRRTTATVVIRSGQTSHDARAMGWEHDSASARRGAG